MTSASEKLVLFLAYVSVGYSMVPQFQTEPRDLLMKRKIIEEEPPIILEHYEPGPAECVFMKIDEGRYQYRSKGGENVCGLYIVSDPDTVIEFHFKEFKVSCSEGSQVDIVDGWELNGQMFPSPFDGMTPLEERVISFCGRPKPKKRFVTAQNVGLLRFKITAENEGFDVDVRFIKNPKPCNVLLSQPSGVFTISNHGRQINCSVSIMAPVKFQMISLSDGLSICRRRVHVNPILEILKRSSSFNELMIQSYGYLNEISSADDCLEYRGGSNLDPMEMERVPFSASSQVEIACKNSVVRLVSSGFQLNSVTIAVEMISELAEPNLVCESFKQYFP